MKIKQCRQRVELYNGAVTRVIPHPLKKNYVLATGAEGKVSCFNLSPFKLEEEYRIFNSFSTCIMALEENLYVGSSLGQLVVMKPSGTIQKRIQISEDCLSSIVSSANYLIVSGFDGVARFLDKNNLSVLKQIDLEVPIWDSESFENKLYLAGNPSFSINLETFGVSKLSRQNSFAIFNSRLYACSDQKGLTCLKTNSNSYIPCNFMLALEDRLMAFSEECVSEIRQEHQMEWKCHRIPEIKKGVAVTSGCCVGNLILLGDNEGALYRLEYEIRDKEQEASLGTDDEADQETQF